MKGERREVGGGGVRGWRGVGRFGVAVCILSREEEVITRQGLKKIGLNWRVFLLLCSWMKEEFLVITVALFDSFSRFW